MSQTQIGNLRIQLSATTANLANDLKKAGSMTKNFASSTVASVEKSSMSFSGIGSTMGGNLMGGLTSILGKVSPFAGLGASVGMGFVNGMGSILSTLNPFEALMPSISQLKALMTTGLAAGSIYAIKLYANVEQTALAFEQLAGGVDKSKKLLSDLREFAAVTPFGSEELTAASRKLLGFGVSVEQQLPVVKMLGELAAGTQSRIEDLAYIYGSVKTQGKAATQDIMQFATRGIPIWDALAKSMKKSNAQVRELVEKGQVGFREITDALTTLTNDGGKFEGMMEKMSDSIWGKWSSLMDNLEMGIVDFGQILADGLDVKGLLTGAEGKVKQLRKMLRDLTPEIQHIASWIRSIGNGLYTGFVNAAGIIRGFGDVFVSVFAGISEHTDSFKSWLDDLKPNFEKFRAVGIDVAETVGLALADLVDNVRYLGAALQHHVLQRLTAIQLAGVRVQEWLGADSVALLRKEHNDKISLAEKDYNRQAREGATGRDKADFRSTAEYRKMVDQREAEIKAILDKEKSFPELIAQLRGEIQSSQAEWDKYKNDVQGGGPTRQAWQKVFDRARQKIADNQAKLKLPSGQLQNSMLPHLENVAGNKMAEVMVKVKGDTTDLMKSIQKAQADGVVINVRLEALASDLKDKFTPEIVKMQKQMRDLNWLRFTGGIDERLHKLGIGDILKAQEDKLGLTEAPKMPSLLTKDSVEAVSMENQWRMQAQYGSNDPMSRVERILNETKAVEQRMESLLRRMAEAFEKAPHVQIIDSVR